MIMTNTGSPVALVTGGAKRIGAEIAATLHNSGYSVAIHYHHSVTEAEQLAEHFNQVRHNSALTVQASLNSMTDIQSLSEQVLAWQGGLHLLVNNASGFFPTSLEEANEAQWHNLMDSNVKGPYFLCQALAPALKKSGGSIVSIADIYAKNPLKGYSIYCMAKAANAMMTKALAKELAPEVRVNGIAPGVILWPQENEQMDDDVRQQIINSVPLQRMGTPKDIAAAILFLANSATYMTGQIIAVDGGSRLVF